MFISKICKPEYITKEKEFCTIEDGAAIYELPRNAKEPKIVAIRVGEEWIPIGD